MEEASGSPSLVLVEQHEALRDGLAVLLERRGFEVLGCATTAARGEEVIAERHPDLAVVGVDLPDERGTELVRRISGNGAGPEVRHLHRAQRSRPARGRLPQRRPRPGREAGRALGPGRRAARGLARRPLLRPQLPAGKNGNGATSGEGAERRESEILGLLAEGLTGEEIAQRLVLSPETVRTHVRNAMEKLGARTRTEAVVKALEMGEVQRQ